MSGNHYQSGDSTKELLAEIKEICDLRKLMAMPCRGCRYNGLTYCTDIKKLKTNRRKNKYTKNKLLLNA